PHPYPSPPSTGARASRSPFLIRQELPIHRDDHPVAFGILLLLNVHLKVNGTHDTVAEHLVNDGLERGAVDLGDLVEAIDEGIGGNGLAHGALGGKLLESRCRLRSK